MNVWLITAFEHIPTDGARPTRFMGLADSLCNRGHTVTLWTGSFRHYDKTHRVEADTTTRVGPNYTVKVLKSWGYKRNISVQRFVAHRHLSRRLMSAMEASHPPDIIHISMPPVGTCAAAVRYAQKRRIPVVVDIIDPWPEVFVAHVPPQVRGLARFVLSPMTYEVRRLFQGVSGLCAISQQYVDWAKSLAPEVAVPSRVFYPGVDMKTVTMSTENNVGDTTLTVVYAGSLGKSYDVETIVSCAQILNDRGTSNVSFKIAGSGTKLDALKHMAEGLPHVHFLGWLGAEELSQLYSEADVGIACYAKGATQSVTYKLFDYLSAGIPIVSSLPGEMEKIIVENDVGYHYEPENAEALADIVQRMASDITAVRQMGIRGRAFAEAHGDNEKIYQSMAQFLEQLASDH